MDARSRTLISQSERALYQCYVIMSFVIFKVEYHKQFESEKGHFTAVSDDPEILRAKKNTDNISNVKYAGASAESRLGISSRGAAEGGMYSLSIFALVI